LLGSVGDGWEGCFETRRTQGKGPKQNTRYDFGQKDEKGRKPRVPRGFRAFLSFFTLILATDAFPMMKRSCWPPGPLIPRQDIEKTSRNPKVGTRAETLQNALPAEKDA